MNWRESIRWALAGLAALLLVPLYFNIENLITRLGWGNVLADAVAPETGKRPVVEFFQHPVTLWVVLLGLGFAAGFWADFLLAKRERSNAEVTKQRLENLGSALNQTLQAIGHALGSEMGVSYEIAVAESETFLLALARNNAVPIPELRADGTETGTLRAFVYLNTIMAPLRLDDDDEVRVRAERIVPDLNRKNSGQLRKEIGHPRVFSSVTEAKLLVSDVTLAEAEVLRGLTGGRLTYVSRVREGNNQNELERWFGKLDFQRVNLDALRQTDLRDLTYEQAKALKWCLSKGDDLDAAIGNLITGNGHESLSHAAGLYEHRVRELHDALTNLVAGLNQI